MKRLALAAAVLAIGAGAASGLWAVLRPPAAALPEIARAPDCAFTDQDGKPVAAADLRGRACIVDFFFSRCTSVCPVLTSRFQKLDATLPPGVLLVSVTMDPLHDTPAVLKAYAKANGAGEKRWKFLTPGTEAQRDAFVRGFLLTVQNTPEDAGNPILHDSRLALVDAAGSIRGYYDSTSPDEMDRLRRDATGLSLSGIYGLPAVNASLNGASLLLLVVAIAFVKAGKYEAHTAFVLGAVLCSTVFLACYLTYHSLAGATRFPGTGTARTLYLTLLASHTILAAIVPPLIIAVIVKAVRRRWDTHKRWARVTVPVWLYVSATGVLIYWVLFRNPA